MYTNSIYIDYLSDSHNTLLKCAMMDPALKPILILVALLLTTISRADAGAEFQPVGGTEYRPVAPAGGRVAVKGEAFHSCTTCNCCRGGGTEEYCASMPCCFTVKCNIPGKPHDVCAFVPVSCNCTSCAA